jgi:molybdopterin adenylyltransferase
VSEIRATVITISDSCHAGTRQDASGPVVQARLRELGWQVTVEILPDEAAQIAARLRELADSQASNVIFTTGGTGIALRDVTPEATTAVIEREIPGLAECMRMEGSKSTKFSVLSRGVCGSRGRTLIVNLPGSPKGALESLNAILDVVPHVIDLLNGRTDHTSTPKLEPVS